MSNKITISGWKISEISGGEILIQAANTNNLALSTGVKFSSWTFTNIDANYGSLLRINEGAKVEIEESSFEKIYTLEEGSVIFAGEKEAEISITNSNFTNNYAVTGGVFNVESSSVVKMYNCTISK